MPTESSQLPALPPLTAEQQGKVLGVLSVGCDRETAANMIGRTPDDIMLAMRADAAFAAEVRRHEAAVELATMKVIYSEVTDQKNWRAAVWWLERRSPERFASRGAGTVTVSHLKAYLTLLGEALGNSIHNADDRERVAAKFVEFRSLAENLADDLLRSSPRLDDPSSPSLALLECDDAPRAVNTEAAEDSMTATAEILPEFDL